MLVCQDGERLLERLSIDRLATHVVARPDND